MSVTRFEPFRDPFREFDRLFSMAASGTRAPLGMPMDVYRGEDGSYHVEADLPGAGPRQRRGDRRARRLDDPGRAHPALWRQRAGHCRRAAPGVVRPAALPRRGSGLREPHRRLRRRCPARDHPRAHRRPRPAGLRSPVRPAAAASCRGAPSSRVRRPPAARAAPTERPCALPPKAVPALSRLGEWPETHAGSTSSSGLSRKVRMLNEEDPFPAREARITPRNPAGPTDHDAPVREHPHRALRPAPAVRSMWHGTGPARRRIPFGQTRTGRLPWPGRTRHHTPPGGPVGQT